MDTKNDSRLWQGKAWSELDDGIPDRLVNSLIPILLLNLGVTATVKRYPQRWLLNANKFGCEDRVFPL